MIRRLKKRFKNLKYRSQLLWAYILCSLVPLIIMGCFCYYETLSLLSRQERTSLESIAQTYVNALDSKAVVYESLLSYLANSDTVTDAPSYYDDGDYEQYEYLKYEYDVLLNGLYTQYPEIRQITLYNFDTDFSHGYQMQTNESLEKESWYSPEAITPNPTWHLCDNGDVMVIRRVPAPYLNYVTEFSDTCIAIRFDPDIFFQSLPKSATSGKIDVVKDGITFFHDSSNVGEDTNTVINWSSATAVSDTGWTLTLEEPSMLLMLPVTEMALLITLLVVLSLFTVLFVSRRLSNYLVHRITRLYNHMQIVKSGNFDEKIHDDSTDEIGGLTNGFQEMTDRLNDMIIQEYKNNLTLKEAQFKALQAQINPHFLYNCLSLINSRALMDDEPEIAQMTQQLSVFYRTTLNKGKTTISLPDEIKNVTSYISIQQLLHDNCFTVSYSIADDLPDISIPNLLLQPLVENAIIHGILPNKDRHGILYLTVNYTADKIRFSVMDNGIGMSEEKADSILSKDSGGYGLKNVNERLRLTYGPDYGLSVVSSPDEGTIIGFTIPCPAEFS